MQTIIFNETGPWVEKLQLADTEISEPSDNEVQIRILARPINPADEMFINGIYRYKPAFPQTAGLEGAGIIEKTGKSVDAALIGQQVAFKAVGTWAEKINLGLHDFRLVPKAIPIEIACQLSLNTLTAYALLERAELTAGQWLLLTAASSSVCKQIIQLAKEKGIKVLALVRNDKYKDTLLQLGANAVLNTEQDDLEKQISAITGNGANAIIDAVGGSLGTIMFNAAAPFGKIIIYGRLSNDSATFHYGTVIYKNLKIEGFGIDNWLKSKSAKELNHIWEGLTTAVARGTLQLGYDKTFDLKGFKEAILFYKNTGGKVILK